MRHARPKTNRPALKTMLTLPLLSCLFLGAAPALGAAFSGTPALPPDFFLQTRLDQKSASWIIDKVRLILANANLSDGMTATTPLSEDTEIPLDDFSTNPEFRRIKDVISQTFKVNPKDAFLRIRIPKIYYKVHHLHARPESAEVISPSVRLKAVAQLQGVDIALPEGVQMDFMVRNPRTKTAEAYVTGFLKAVSIVVPKTLEPAEFEVDLEAMEDQEFRFKLIGSRLDALPGYVNRHLDEIRISSVATGRTPGPEDLSINPVVVRLNSLSRSISLDEFKPLLQKRAKEILSAVVRRIGAGLKDTIGPSILKLVFSKTLPSSLSISTDSVFTRYRAGEFSKPDRDQLMLAAIGDLCTAELYEKFKESCAEHMRFNPPVRLLPPGDELRSREEVRDRISEGQAEVALSVSEHYLNRLLQTTIDSKLWDEMLKAENLELGPKGAFVVLNHANAAPELYLDIVYKGGKGLQSIFINSRNPIRFPLRLSTQTLFKGRHSIPVLVITIAELKSDVSEIIRGIPEYDLPSDLVPGLRRRVASMILRMAQELEGRNAIEMEVPVFRGLGLETARIETSAYGRLNLYFKL
jgi:hypothetical protein